MTGYSQIILSKLSYLLESRETEKWLIVLRYGWSRQAAHGLGLNESFDHRCESLLILAANRLELQAHSTTSSDEAHRGTGPNFSVLYKEMQLDRRIDRARFLCLDKKPPHTQIPHS